MSTRIAAQYACASSSSSDASLNGSPGRTSAGFKSLHGYPTSSHDYWRALPILAERYRLWHRWIGALRVTDLPVHIVWARQDPVAVEKMAHVLHEEITNSDLRLLDGVGHFPMIEATERWCAAVLDALSSEPA